jgi:hypothetical protein
MPTTISNTIVSQQSEAAEIRKLLENISRKTYTPDQGVIRHETPPNQISIPQTMPTPTAAKILNEKAAAEAEIKPFVHDFEFRPMDGANAVRQTMLQYFGTTGRGVMNQNADITIAIGPKEKIKVPWGHFNFAPLKAKVEALRRTAKISNDAGRTFIMFPPKGNLDDLERTIAVARQHQPSIIAIEDIDSLMKDGDPIFKAKMSNLIDGMETKEDEVMIVMTTNRVEALDSQMTRKGRIDVLTFFGPLDRDALERMVRGVIGEDNLDPETDFDEVFKYMAGWTPSFIRGAFEDAKRAAGFRICRESKAEGLDPNVALDNMRLTTEDFVAAAIANVDHFERYINKKDAPAPKDVDTVLAEMVSSATLDALTSDQFRGRLQGSGDVVVFETIGK